MNIFTVIGRTTKRIEPFHSRFLSEALTESLTSDQALFDQFWDLAVAKDSNWPRPDQPNVTPEDTIWPMRVDLTIVDDNAMLCLGIEVKTDDKSTQIGQLSCYQAGLEDKYPNHKVRMAYLTPFNRARAGDETAGLHSIAEFDAFAIEHPEAVNLSWLDVAGIDWPAGGDIWQQHQTYIREVICQPRTRTRVLRGLDTIFGPQIAKDFFTALSGCGTIDSDGFMDLDSVTDPVALADAFRILIESPSANQNSTRSDQFGRDLSYSFRAASTGPIHVELLSLSYQYPWVWVKGQKDYAIRIAHPDHRSGVSLCTIYGPNKLRTGQRRYIGNPTVSP